jgi:hypothetical protein
MQLRVANPKKLTCGVFISSPSQLLILLFCSLKGVTMRVGGKGQCCLLGYGMVS